MRSEGMTGTKTCFRQWEDKPCG